MPISIGDLQRDVRTCTIELHAGTLTVTYRPSAVNAAQEAREQEQRDAGAVLRSLAQSLSETIVSWDLLDEDGEPYPLTHEVLTEVEDEDGVLVTDMYEAPHPILMQLGIGNLTAISRGILEDLLPNLTRGGSSAAGSSAKTTPSLPPARPGGRSSKRRAT